MSLKITPTSSVRIIVRCEECKHPEDGRNAAYEWTDTDGTVYYEGSTLASLLDFISEHSQ